MSVDQNLEQVTHIEGKIQILFVFLFLGFILTPRSFFFLQSAN
jgi:hypothetical protein